MQNIFEQKFGKAIDILKIIEKNGYEAYFVGGCVRDYLLDVDFSDIDVTTNAAWDCYSNIQRRSL